MIIKFSTKTLIPFLLLASCSSYEVSVNNQVLYTPPPLYSDYYIADPDLSHCVKSSIREKQIVKMEDLEELFCPPGDIQSLSGLETFKKLKKLGLGKNKINKLEGIQQLLELQHLDLSENNLVTVYELAHLKKLLYVDLRNNTLLDCSTFTSEVDASKIILPKHCK